MNMLSLHKWIQYTVVIIAAAGITYTLVQALTDPRTSVTVGEAAPLFELGDSEGETIHLQQYRGQGVMLNFWASWCTACVNELPLLNEAYKLKDTEVMAINIGEDEETVRKFADRYDLSFPILLDSDMEVKKQYQITGLPLTLLIDENGIILERHEGEFTEMSEILEMMEKISYEPLALVTGKKKINEQ